MIQNGESNLVRSTDLRTTLGCFPTGVTVVTTIGSTGNPLGLTVNSFNSLSLEPPLILWSLKRNSMHLREYLEAQGFVINILSSTQRNICQRFSKDVKDRFENIDWYESISGLPILSSASAILECENEECHEGGDHMIFVGRVLQHFYSSLDPMVIVRGQYASCLGVPTQKAG